MKILLTLFIFLFSTSVFSDDISDFQVEGMSIGLSALDFFTTQELIENMNETSYVKKDYTRYSFYKSSFFTKYDSVVIYVKSNDKNYII